MNPAVWGGYAVSLIIINAIFWSLPRELGSEDEQITAKDKWILPTLAKVEKTDLELLLSSGFWGDASKLLNGGASGVGERSISEVESAEAKKLRAQVKAIIKGSSGRQVLFSIENRYVKISVGELLPNTTWQLVEAGEDWLKLSKDGGEIQLLRLFNVQIKNNGASKP